MPQIPYVFSPKPASFSVAPKADAVKSELLVTGTPADPGSRQHTLRARARLILEKGTNYTNASPKATITITARFGDREAHQQAVADMVPVRAHEVAV